MLARAELVNAAQYTHGINSTKSGLKWWLKEIELENNIDRDRICESKIVEYTLKLGGYLYALQNNL